ncbi:MAG: type I-C CRISPR-associated protein Cas7/Csd2 [Ruminococcus sp.]
METLQNKIDFVGFISVEHANPNGDPLNGNRPRDTTEGYGEISDVCIKRKIRNRLQDMGEEIFVQSQDNIKDGFKSLKDRFDKTEELKKVNKNDKEAKAKAACEKWIDVRSFGQVFAFKDTDSVSLGVRGPVTIHTAFSLNPVDIISSQIVKSANGTTTDGDKKSTDTMGTKHRVKFGVYKIKGSINCQLAEKTGFTHKDAEKIKEALRTLFENDASSARPDGSMCMEKLFWFEHNCKSGQYSSAKVHKSIYAKPLTKTPESIDDYDIGYDNSLDGLVMEIIE